MFPMLRVGFALLFGWVTAMAALAAQAQTGPEAAAQLGARVFPLLARGTTVLLEFQSMTPLPPAEWLSFRTALEDELRKAGAVIAAVSSETRVRISVSENAHGRLLIAEVLTGETRQVALAGWAAAPAAETAPRAAITRKLIWKQSDPLLDFQLFDGGNTLLVLGTAQVVSYRWVDGKWTQSGVASISPSRPAARDARGRLGIAAAGFRVYLPGTTCSGDFAPALKVACAPGDEPWPSDSRAAWISDRNLMEASGVRAPFYSEAGGLFAMADGNVANRAGQPFPGAETWGSDIAAAANPCAANADAVAAAAAGDDPSNDRIEFYAIANGRAEPVGEPSVFPGQVTALWPSETKAQVKMVVRNAKTGEYEAYRLGLACAE